MASDKRAVDAHEKAISEVVHKQEEFCLSARRLSNKFVHLLQCGHARCIAKLFSTNIDSSNDFSIARLFSTAVVPHKLEHERCIVVSEIVSGKYSESPKHNIQIVTFMT